MIKVFGIRHHGPGSALSLKKALSHTVPDCIVIEAPADAKKLVQYVANEKLVPPVAMLIYNPKNFAQATYLPFAKFSPEWQAMKFALKNNVPVRFMDLPMDKQFSISAEEQEAIQFEFFEHKKGEESKVLRKDPIGHFARLAGYSDSERWWEITFENQENEEAVFDSILEMMTALREEITEEDGETLRREAYMRKTIRAVEKEGFDNIAVVCGAYHTPALSDLKKYKQSSDNAILRGIKKTTTKATWIPWSYGRLSFQSGYGAGVISPAWYQLLFSKRTDIVTRWMAKAARLFRKEDLSASPAHVLSAVRLADTLAAIRDLSVPGIDELHEAATTIFCDGDAVKMQLITKKLIIGDRFGNIPDEIPVTPLQQNFEKAVKSARLTGEKQSTETIDKKLDLRKKTNLQASHLLHRLRILGINWGEKQKGSRYQTGGFSESWKLTWKPEFIIKIIEMGMWGSTVENAATRFAIERGEKTDSLPEISNLLKDVLNAELPAAIDFLVKKLKNLSAISEDVFHLMDTLRPLVEIIRYGSTRKTDIASVEQVVHQIIPRVCIGLPGACTQIADDLAQTVFQRLLSTNYAIRLFNDKTHIERWNKALLLIATSKESHRILSGMATRILFDKKKTSVEKTGNLMYYALSKANKPLDAAHWLEGFLYGSGLLLIHTPELWDLLDGWVSDLKWEDFKEVLPLLRRVFSQFSLPEREQMMSLVKNAKGRKDVVEVDSGKALFLQDENVKRILPLLQKILE